MRTISASSATSTGVDWIPAVPPFVSTVTLAAWTDEVLQHAGALVHDVVVVGHGLAGLDGTVLGGSRVRRLTVQPEGRIEPELVAVAFANERSDVPEDPFAARLRCDRSGLGVLREVQPGEGTRGGDRRRDGDANDQPVLHEARDNNRMRLNAYLARAGLASRRKADELIVAGRVTVNGEPGQLNTFVSGDDVVEVDGQAVTKQRLAYVLLHKPAGVVTTARDPGGRPTVVDLVEHEARVVPVGRLDADTTGALLLTNDGALAHRLAHPRYEVDKVYEVEVEGSPSDDALRQLAEGVELEDGPHRARGGSPPRPVPNRGDAARGPQAPGEADVRGGRPSRPAPAPLALRHADPRRSRPGRVA